MEWWSEVRRTCASPIEFEKLLQLVSNDPCLTIPVIANESWSGKEIIQIILEVTLAFGSCVLKWCQGSMGSRKLNEWMRAETSFCSGLQTLGETSSQETSHWFFYMYLRQNSKIAIERVRPNQDHHAKPSQMKNLQRASKQANKNGKVLKSDGEYSEGGH